MTDSIAPSGYKTGEVNIWDIWRISQHGLGGRFWKWPPGYILRVYMRIGVCRPTNQVLPSSPSYLPFLFLSQRLVPNGQVVIRTWILIGNICEKLTEQGIAIYMYSWKRGFFEFVFFCVVCFLQHALSLYLILLFLHDNIRSNWRISLHTGWRFFNGATYILEVWMRMGYSDNGVFLKELGSTNECTCMTQFHFMIPPEVLPIYLPTYHP